MTPKQVIKLSIQEMAKRMPYHKLHAEVHKVVRDELRELSKLSIEQANEAGKKAVEDYKNSNSVN